MLLGRYEILETIGQGTTSSVSKARDTLIGRIVALKILRPDLSDKEWGEKFLGEARIVGQLSHPSIVSLHDVGIDESSGAPYLVMEYVTGQTLEQLLAAGTSEPRQVFSWGAELARALAYAHRHGVIHGDVKPGNILLNADGQVKLTDFGIARWATQISQSGNLRGTPAYLSPEQIEGRATDGRSDLFSLGIVLYQLATGRRPFQGDSVATVCAQILKAKVTPPTQVNPGLPPALNGVLARCLAKNPADRYADGEELAAALEAIAGRSKAASSKETRAKPSAVFFRRYGWATGLLLIALSVPAMDKLRLPAPPTAVFLLPKPPADSRPPAAVAVKAEETPPAESLLEARNQEQDPSSKSVEPAKNRANSTFAAKTLQGTVQPISTGARKDPRATTPSNTTVAAKIPPETPRPKPASLLANEPDISRGIAAAQLTIEISPNASNETLAVFADRQLLFTTSLAAMVAKEGEPFRASCTLPSGQHHFSVALYKADKTLRAEKEGLADLRKGTQNVLSIQVTKRSKFFPLRGPGLKIDWPSEPAPVEPDRSTSDPPKGAPPTNSKFQSKCS